MAKEKPHTHEPWRAFRARQRNPDTKREAVLETAAKLFLEFGYRRTSLNQLALRLNITKPALYYYFSNKEQILVECYRLGIAMIEDGLEQATRRARRASAALRPSGFDRLEAYTRAYATTILTHDFGRCVAMLDDSELSVDARLEVRTLKRQIDYTLRAYIAAGIADGSIAPANPKLASFAISGAINWMGRWYRPQGELSPAAIAEEFTRLLTAGHRGQPARRTARAAVRKASGARAVKQARKTTAAKPTARSENKTGKVRSPRKA